MPNDVRTLARSLAATDTSTEAWGDARARLYKELEAGLRAFVKEQQPSSASGAFWEYRDGVLDGLRDDDVVYRVVDSIFSVSATPFEKVAKKAMASLKSKGRGDERAQVAARFPEYAELGKEIREAKAAWTVADKAIKGTYEFRMMGGLARMGLPEGRRYKSLVERAQRMEREVLGRHLTEASRPRG